MDTFRLLCDVYANWYALAPVAVALLCVLWLEKRRCAWVAAEDAMEAAANPHACMVASDRPCLPPPPTYTHDGFRHVVNDGHWHV